MIKMLKVLEKTKPYNIPNFYEIYLNESQTTMGLLYDYIKGLSISDYMKVNKLSIIDEIGLLIQLVEIIIHLHSADLPYGIIPPKKILIS